jgi:prepilin-type N-terminal cleavage/methylation domain-containing protein
METPACVMPECKSQVMLKRITSSRAFTLVELLVVILVLAILMAVILPGFLNQGNKAHDTAARASLNVAWKAAAAWTPGAASFDVDTSQPVSSNARVSRLVSAVAASDPEMVVAAGDFNAAVGGAAKDVFISPASQPTKLVLFTRSGSGHVICLIGGDGAAAGYAPPVFGVDSACPGGYAVTGTIGTPIFTSPPLVDPPDQGAPLTYTYVMNGTPYTSTGAPPPGTTITDNWFSCDTLGAGCVPAPGSPPVASDCSHSYKVTVTAANPKGSAVASSAVSSVSCGVIVYSGGAGPDIRKVNADGSGDVLLAGNGILPDVSPDGKTVVFERGNSGVYMMNIDGSDVHLVTSGTKVPLGLAASGSNAGSPTFSPDGSQIAYADWALSSASGPGVSYNAYMAIYAIAASTRGNTSGGSKVVTNGLPGSLSGQAGIFNTVTPKGLVWTPSGIFFIAGSREFSYNCTSGTPLYWVAGNYENDIPGYPNWNATNGWPCTSGGTLTQRAPQYDGLRVQTLWQVNGGTATQISSYATKVTTSDTVDNYPAVSPNGLTVSYAHFGAVSQGVRLRTIATGTETVLPGSSNCCDTRPPRWSPNGKQILVTIPGAPGNQIVDASTGAFIRSISGMLSPSQGWDWAPRPTS